MDHIFFYFYSPDSTEHKIPLESFFRMYFWTFHSLKTVLKLWTGANSPCGSQGMAVTDEDSGELL